MTYRREASEVLSQQFVDGGVIPGQLVGQDAVSKRYVDDQLALRDEAIADAESSAAQAQADIDQHEASTTAHPAQHITYSGAAPGNNVKQGLDNTYTRISEIVAQSGDDNTEIVDARGGYPVLGDRLNASDAQLAEKANQTALDETNETIVANSLSEVMDIMTKGQVAKTVCYGDSLTFGYKVGTGVQVANPFPAELQSKLRLIYGNNNINVVNKGHTGWRSSEAVANVQEVIDESPHVAVVMFGINDCKGSSFGSIVPVDTFIANMKNVVRSLKKAGICVVLCSTTPYLANAIESKKIKPYNQALKSIAIEFNLDFVDMEKEVATIYQEKFLSDLTLMPDGIHFGDAYYAYLAHIIIQKFWIFPDASPNVSIPAVFSPFVVTDTTTVYTDAGQFYGRNIILRGTGGVNDGSYIRFPFLNKKGGLKLYILHPKSPSGTEISVRLYGAVVATLDSYNSDFVYDVETSISENIGYGLQVVELLRTDSTTPGPGGFYNNFVSAFVFK